MLRPLGCWFVCDFGNDMSTCSYPACAPWASWVCGWCLAFVQEDLTRCFRLFFPVCPSSPSAFPRGTCGAFAVMPQSWDALLLLLSSIFIYLLLSLEVPIALSFSSEMLLLKHTHQSLCFHILLQLLFLPLECLPP